MGLIQYGQYIIIIIHSSYWVLRSEYKKTMPLYGVFKDTKQFNGARSSNNVAYKTLSEKSDLTRPFFKSREKTCRK